MWVVCLLAILIWYMVSESIFVLIRFMIVTDLLSESLLKGTCIFVILRIPRGTLLD